MSDAMMPIDVDEHGRLVYEEGIEPYIIRTSDRDNFKKCRRLWSFTSPLQRNLEPIRMNKNLAFGIDFHKGMESLYHPSTFHHPVQDRVELAIAALVLENNRQRMEEEAAIRGDLYDERIEEYNDREELGIGMLKFYGKWVEQTGADDDIGEILGVELMFQVPLTEETGEQPLVINGRPVVYQVRLDLVYRRKSTGGIVIMDHKTTSSMGDDSFLDLDTQISSYILAAQAWFKERVERADYNEVLKNPPHKPKVLKKGDLSQDKRQNTTHELYMEAITELGLDPAPYSAMLAYLRERPVDYVRRTPIVRSPRELSYQHQLMVMEVRDMVTNPSIYPSPSKMNCNGCDFRVPCGVANEVGDVDFVLDDPRQYRPRQGELDKLTV